MRLTTDEEYLKIKKRPSVNLTQEKMKKSFEDRLKKVKKFERTKYLACMHDGSSVGSHSPLLVNALYNTANFLSYNEYYLKHKKKINVQASVEEPNMYILARCSSTDQQLLYSDERTGDIMNLKYSAKSANNVDVNDVLRFFKRDSPAPQFEGGQKKGGNFSVVFALFMLTM